MIPFSTARKVYTEPVSTLGAMFAFPELETSRFFGYRDLGIVLRSEWKSDRSFVCTPCILQVYSRDYVD
jgi:hypothetical protein